MLSLEASTERERGVEAMAAMRRVSFLGASSTPLEMETAPTQPVLHFPVLPPPEL
jgi:hypothetical protein